MDETGYRMIEHILAFGLSFMKHSEPSNQLSSRVKDGHRNWNQLEPWHLVRLVLHIVNKLSLEVCWYIDDVIAISGHEYCHSNHNFLPYIYIHNCLHSRKQVQLINI